MAHLDFHLPEITALHCLTANALKRLILCYIVFTTLSNMETEGEKKKPETWGQFKGTLITPYRTKRYRPVRTPRAP